MGYSDDFREGMEKLATIYVTTFQNNPDETLQMFCNTTVPLEVMNSVYGYFVNENSIQKIEDLPQDIKMKLWNQAKVTCPNASKDKTVRLCRCIWMINFILEK